MQQEMHFSFKPFASLKIHFHWASFIDFVIFVFCVRVEKYSTFLQFLRFCRNRKSRLGRRRLRAGSGIVQSIRRFIRSDYRRLPRWIWQK